MSYRNDLLWTNSNKSPFNKVLEIRIENARFQEVGNITVKA